MAFHWYRGNCGLPTENYHNSNASKGVTYVSFSFHHSFTRARGLWILNPCHDRNLHGSRKILCGPHREGHTSSGFEPRSLFQGLGYLFTMLGRGSSLGLYRKSERSPSPIVSLPVRPHSGAFGPLFFMWSNMANRVRACLIWLSPDSWSFSPVSFHAHKWR